MGGDEDQDGKVVSRTEGVGEQNQYEQSSYYLKQDGQKQDTPEKVCKFETKQCVWRQNLWSESDIKGNVEMQFDFVALQ